MLAKQDVGKGALPRRGVAMVVVSAVLLLLTVGAAFAADPTDKGFGTQGIAEIEALVEVPEDREQVGGIVDLERDRDGGLLAAVYGIARGGHYFAATRIEPNGALDESFGEGGFTRYFDVSRRRHESEGGVLDAEGIAQAPNGDVVLAGYFENEGAYAPALARFTPAGQSVKSFGDGGKVAPHPAFAGKLLTVSEEGGELLHDVAVEPNGTIVGVGHVVGGRPDFDYRAPKEPAAIVLAYRPNGRVDRSFGRNGRFEIKVPHGSAATSFSQVKALPSGKLLVSGYVKGQLVLYRLTADGRRDGSFGGGDGEVTVGRPASEYGEALDRAPFAVEPGGRIVLCAVISSRSIQDSEPVVLVRFSPTGVRDRGFGKTIYAEQAPVDRRPPLTYRKHVEAYHFEPQGLAVDSEGRIVVTGGETAPYTRGQKEGGYSYFAARRFLPNGRRDKGFGESGVFPTNPPGSESYARAAVTEDDGQVVGGGWVQIERGGGNGPGNTALLLTRYR
jgi:uncharacterized delta-60 repeat protein